MGTRTRRPEPALALATEAKAVGRRIRDAREAAGLTQSALAFGIVSPAYVSRIENGDRRPSRAVLEGFAARLGRTPDELLHPQDASSWTRLGLAQTYVQSLLEQARGTHDSGGGLGDGALDGVAVARAAVRTEAFVLLRSGEFSRARVLLEWICDQGSDEVPGLDVLAALCRCYVALELTQAAVAIGTQALERIQLLNSSRLPEATEALYWLHQAYLASGDPVSARRVAEEALAANAASASGYPLAYTLLEASSDYARRGRAADAAVMAERAVVILDLARQRALLEELRSGVVDVSANPVDRTPGT